VLPQSVIHPRPQPFAVGPQYSPSESGANNITPGLPLAGVLAKDGQGKEQGMTPVSPKPRFPLELQTRRTW